MQLYWRVVSLPLDTSILMEPLSLLRSVVFTTAALSTLNAFAGLPWCKSRTIESKNGQFVLVLLTPEAERRPLAEFVEYVNDVFGHLDDSGERELIESFEAERTLEETYSASGLYAKGESTQPIWTLPYISLCQEMYVANDGIHLVIMYSPWDSTCSDIRQLSFVSSGITTFSYRDEWEFMPLISLRLLMQACLEIALPVDNSSYISADSTEFIVRTNQGDRLVFDLATGTRLKRSSPLLLLCILLPVMIVPFGLWLCTLMRERIRTSKENPTAKGFHFSLFDLLGFLGYVGCSLAAVKILAWFGGACVLITTLGGVIAGFPSTHKVRLIAGAILALYGAYVAIVLFAIIDDQLINAFNVVPLWWKEGWWQLCIPLSMMFTFAVCGALFARRMPLRTVRATTS
jgi:hypothetical protein